jgi:hypothetical protein
MYGIFMRMVKKLRWLDSAHWTGVSARTAIGTQFGVYLVDITRRNCTHRTFICTCAACGTIFCDFVSHSF